MENHEQMNWTKKQTQNYGMFCAILGLAIGLIVMYGIMQ